MQRRDHGSITPLLVGARYSQRSGILASERAPLDAPQHRALQHRRGGLKPIGARCQEKDERIETPQALGGLAGDAMDALRHRRLESQSWILRSGVRSGRARAH